MSSELTSLVARLEAVAGRLESAAAAAPAGAAGGGGGGGDGGGGGSGSAMVEAYDELISTTVQPFVDAANKIGAEAAGQAASVLEAFQAQKEFLVVVSKSKKPDEGTFGSMLEATSAKIGEVQAAKANAPRKTTQMNHLSFVEGSIGGLAWVMQTPKPGPYVKDMKEAGEFYGNRVIKEFKGKDDDHVAYARAYSAIWTDLQAYIKQYHTTGLTWNPDGAAATAPAAAAPAPAPPKPKPKPAAGASGAKAGLFAALNKGGGVTAGLKKVDRTQMTHKNPELRGSSVVKAGAVAAKPPAKKWGAGSAKVYDPVCELQGKKWVIEHQKNNKKLVVEIDDPKQTVYAYKCEGSTIQIKGKAASITLDGCKKSAIVFEDCVAAFEVINCQSVQAQTTGKVATVSIDKTDGCQLYLSAASIDVEVITAKSSEMNISVPNPDDPDGDMLEMAVPEQYKTTFNKAAKKLVTEPTDIAG